MNWLTNFIRPKIRAITAQKETPDNLWQKCPSCEGMLFHRDLRENMNICYHCGYHMRVAMVDRLRALFDNGEFQEIQVPRTPHDPLKFRDRKRYADRLKESRAKTGRDDAIIVAQGLMGGVPVVVAGFDFDFMGGSMGAAVGEGIVTAAQVAARAGAALIAIPSSGGARMQEGAISLMQMPRTIAAVDMVKEAGLPYIVLLTDPTTGGVSASFAMIGDIHIAEPGCTIGFAGKRVIQETIREELPKGFQTAEYLLAHGMVDMVVPRKEQRETIIRILDLVFRKTKDSQGFGENGAAPGGNGRRNGKKKGRGGGIAALRRAANINKRSDKKVRAAARR
ncbi:MAG: acetyl-CoA carboxylase carboxyltransferase subunit beta [Proteobacteria bacterium]|nr:acetyl-CoA carboxylase carboxyltransferase subunit beta [Pseudomonadota bacterium]